MEEVGEMREEGSNVARESTSFCMEESTDEALTVTTNTLDYEDDVMMECDDGMCEPGGAAEVKEVVS